ncbi:MAG: L,D-transpeptidase [Propionibacteriaceae bacterium]|jgi:hypothetical protein|nr:L,D-transpeptidase [Propionibacteriaceae bacterium]
MVIAKRASVPYPKRKVRRVLVCCGLLVVAVVAATGVGYRIRDKDKAVGVNIVAIPYANEMANKLNAIVAHSPTIVFQGEPVYTITAQDIADWHSSAPDGLNSTYRISFDETLIVTALRTTLMKVFNVAAQPEVQLSSANGERVLGIAGVMGRSLRDEVAAATTIAEALTAAASGTVSEIELDWVATPYQVKVANIGPIHPAEHWADVNLTTQTLTMFDGSQPVKTIWISSGKPETPTPQGHHPVAPGQKSLDANLSGSDFYYEHVTWIGWNNMYGVHSAYWHTNFGIPQSHGCINVSPDQIMDVYNWLAVGDYIEVHE